MLRRLGKHLILISIPLFILLLIHYHNHAPLTDRNKLTIQTHNSEFISNSAWPIAKQENDVQHWKVLHDGTVIHRGHQDQHRKCTFVDSKINLTSRCASLRSDKGSFLVVVESDIINFEERQLIRDTWALSILQQVANYRVIFLVGLTRDIDTQHKLDYENIIYQDIVQIGIYEDFQNLTYKSIHMLQWYTRFCANANFLFKTDDDIYLHIPNIVNLLNATSLNGSILCHQNKSRKILRTLSDIRYYMYAIKNTNTPKQEVIKQVRKKFKKYLISFDTLPGILFPEYCSGFTYAMNYEVAVRLLQASFKIPYFGIEDVFITGLCREKSNVTIIDSEHFRLKPFIQPIEATCAFENGRITSNEMTKEDLRKLWTNVNTQGYYCKMTTDSNN